MPPGTATISPYCHWFVVQYARIGSELHCQPLYFRTENEARDFCREHCLKII